MPSRRDSVARVGVEPTDFHQGLSLAALPICVPCHPALAVKRGLAPSLRGACPLFTANPASRTGFEPVISTVTRWRGLRTPPQGHQSFSGRPRGGASHQSAPGESNPVTRAPKARGLPASSTPFSSGRRVRTSIFRVRAGRPTVSRSPNSWTTQCHSGSGRRSRTFIACFKDRQPTISRSPSHNKSHCKLQNANFKFAICILQFAIPSLASSLILHPSSFLQAEGEGVEPSRLIARPFSRRLPSPFGLPFRFQLRRQESNLQSSP